MNFYQKRSNGYVCHITTFVFLALPLAMAAGSSSQVETAPPKRNPSEGVIIKTDPILDRVVKLTYPKMTIRKLLERLSREQGFGIAASGLDDKELLEIKAQDKKLRNVIEDLCASARLNWKWHKSILSLHPKPKTGQDALLAALPKEATEFLSMTREERSRFGGKQMDDIVNSLSTEQRVKWKQLGYLPLSDLNEGQRKSVNLFFATSNLEDLLRSLQNIENRSGMKVAIGYQPGDTNPTLSIVMPGEGVYNIGGPLVKGKSPLTIPLLKNTNQ